MAYYRPGEKISCLLYKDYKYPYFEDATVLENQEGSFQYYYIRFADGTISVEGDLCYPTKEGKIALLKKKIDAIQETIEEIIARSKHCVDVPSYFVDAIARNKRHIEMYNKLINSL